MLVDAPIDHENRVLLVERRVESLAELQGLGAAYVEHSTSAGCLPSWPAVVRSTTSRRSPPIPR